MTDTAVNEPIGATQAAQHPDELTRCVACREDIRSGATICTHCKSAQNWSRHVQDWKNVGSAAAALVPLWTAAFALWSLAFREPSAEVRAASIVCERARIVFAVANDGDATAVLSLPQLKMRLGSKEAQPPGVDLVLQSPADYSYVLASKQASKAEVKPRISGVSDDFPTKPAQSTETCSLVVEVAFRGFKGRKGVASADCPCA